jgi:hypothetical protein
VEVTSLRGAASLVIDRALQSGMVRAGWHIDDFPAFRKVGVRIFSPITTASEGFWQPPVWVAPDTWDYGRVDETLKKIVSGIPDAWILLRVELSAPAWWRERHAGETVKTRDAAGRIVPLLLPHAYPAFTGGERWIRGSPLHQYFRRAARHAPARDRKVHKQNPKCHFQFAAKNISSC